MSIDLRKAESPRLPFVTNRVRWQLPLASHLHNPTRCYLEELRNTVFIDERLKLQRVWAGELGSAVWVVTVVGL